MVCYALSPENLGFHEAKRGKLVLKDGTEFPGFVFGASAPVAGEVGKKLVAICFFVANTVVLGYLD